MYSYIFLKVYKFKKKHTYNGPEIMEYYNVDPIVCLHVTVTGKRRPVLVLIKVGNNSMVALYLSLSVTFAIN